MGVYSPSAFSSQLETTPPQLLLSGDVLGMTRNCPKSDGEKESTAYNGGKRSSFSEELHKTRGR